MYICMTERHGNRVCVCVCAFMCMPCHVVHFQVNHIVYIAKRYRITNSKIVSRLTMCTHCNMYKLPYTLHFVTAIKGNELDSEEKKSEFSLFQAIWFRLTSCNVCAKSLQGISFVELKLWNFVSNIKVTAKFTLKRENIVEKFISKKNQKRFLSRKKKSRMEKIDFLFIQIVCRVLCMTATEFYKLPLPFNYVKIPHKQMHT